MITLTGYEIKAELHVGEKSIVYRAKKGDTPVILKYLNKEYPTNHELEAFRKEYDIIKKFSLAHSVKVLGVESYKNSLVIIFEDIGASSLAALLDEKKNFGIEEFVEIAIAATKALAEIQKHNMIHKDLKPHNIVYNSNSKTLNLIDFGSVSFLTKESPEINMKNNLEGTLAYISPEQTGRMNRTVDYRTDYYSLGVTFYQLLTGELPFTNTDPMELVHAHIAKMPIPPHSRDAQPCVSTLSDIIMKLLQKNPEDRYQSIAGLLYDLEWCLNNLSPDPAGVVQSKELSPLLRGEGITLINPSDDFKIGTHDHSGKFQIPEKLYGRTNEINQIIESFKDIVGTRGGTSSNGDVKTHSRASLQLISGHSGIGKSALINEVNKPITEYKGYFGSGKYDQFKRAIPYGAITQTFQSLIQQILTEKSESISQWKERLLQAVGSNGQVIIDVIPELETLIGKQQQPAELGSTESQNRFNLVFQNFIQAFCTKEHPIAIFLDDMQWADTPSIKLIQTILSNPEMKYLYLMLSFRDNEVLPTDPFSLMLAELKKSGFVYKEIILTPIGISDITHLVKDTLNCEESNAKELATILFEKTNGNPFFVNELFTSFYKDGLVYLDSGLQPTVLSRPSVQWKWDISKIREAKISENVIDLMVEKVQELTPNQMEILKLAACIGDTFETELLSQISGKSSGELKTELEQISNEGFLLIGGNTVKFVHDKIREATYSLISEEERAKNHYAIGSTYLKITKEEDIEDLIFTIVGQLNQCTMLLSEQEKNQLIDLNVLAGEKALASSAYDVALDCYRIAMQFFPKDIWETSYQKALSIYLNRAKLESLNGNHAEADQFFTIILENTNTILDKALVYELQIPLYVGQNKLREALDIGLKALAILGIDFPEVHDPTPEVMKAFQLQGERQIEELIDLRQMTSPEKLAITRILAVSIVPAYITLPSLFPLTVLKMVNLTLEDNSLAKESGLAFILYGIIMGSGIGNYELGNKLGKLGIKIIEKLNAKNLKCAGFFFFACMNNHWREHARLDLPYFLESIQAGMDSGDFLNAGYSTNHFNFQSLLMRKNLSEVSSSFSKFLSNFAKLKQEDPKHMFCLNYEMSIILQGLGKSLMEMNGDIFNEKEIVSIWKETKNSTTLFNYYVNKLTLNYLFGSPLEAYRYAREGEPHEGGCFGMMFVAEHNFWDSLSCLSLLELPDSSEEDKTKYLEQIQKNQERMKVWAENCPANYGHKYHIVNGLLIYSMGDFEKARQELKKAIALAKEHEYLLEEALANEFLAKMWLEKEEDQIANIFLIEAHYAYKKWGCEPKVKQLEEKYPQLKRHAKQEFAKDVSVSSNSNASATGTLLDLNTVVKASQAISGEIHLGKLLKKMMKILFENAGAERGFFILKENQNWIIEAEGNANTDTITVLEAKPLEDKSQLSSAIVNYVIRTKGIILLNDAMKKGAFTNDSYVVKRQPKSILCYPIINQGNLVGVVYLENNLTTDAFTPDRVEILKVLSSQIAVSVENSLLYANLEEKVEERTRDLNQALVEVRGLKEQQDGDYFLNTLLIEPLGQNNAFSKNVGIDFFIKQKKTFIFRRNEYELGGDINIAENMELQGKEYTVFLNGDAMGKSIQGAGGVLVLGTVFKSIIQRTKATDYGKTVYPERWLKNAFIEMHKSFEGFDGSMLMSAVFGLVDEQTGTMYYMNAEHPPIALYRDGLASFIENPKHYTKLGTQGQMGSISVSVFSLHSDDIVIIGSDGRDDICIGKDSEGYEIINQDENLFLNHIKIADGDLEKIQEEISNTGKLIDDLSLLKIHFKGGSKDSSQLEADLEKLEEYKAKKDFPNVIEYGIKVISDYPHLSEYMYDVSYALRQVGKLERAVDFGERFRMRRPEHLDNLMNLIDTYKGLGRMERAKVILDDCIKLDPEEIRILKFKKELEIK